MKAKFKNIIPRFGIQGKLTLIFILLSTVPLILVSIYTVSQQINYKEEENLREMESDIKGLKERTSLFLTRVESEINLVMKSTELKKLTANLNNDIPIEDQLQANAEKEFINIVNDNDIYVKIDLLNKKGKEILSVINDKTKPYAVERKNLSRTVKNYYVQMIKTLAPGEIELSPSEIRLPDSDDFTPVIDFILPFYDHNNKVIAIATIKIRAEKLFELLVPSYGSSQKKVFIVNGEGYYIFNSERKDNWNSLFTDRYDENLFEDYSEETAINILKGKEKTTLYHKDRIIQSSPIFSGSKAVTDRYFIIEDVDADIVMSSTEELQLILFILIITVAVVSLVAGFFTARRFLKPVKQLIKGTQIIRQGNLDYKLEIKTQDEIQDLINNFNQLVNEWKKKQALEKEVRKSEKLFSSLTQTATDAILEIDEKGIAKVWNDAATKIFGYSKEEVIGKNIIPLIVPKKHWNTAGKKLASFLKGETGFNNGTLEVTALRKNGIEFPAELSISSVKLDDVKYATGIIRDITQRKKMLKELIEAKEKAEVADKLKTEFLNQMSHEIRTPLNILLNVSDIIYYDLKEKNLLSEDINQSLKDIKESGARIIRTVELILSMSEIQTGSYKNKPVETDLYENILKNVYANFNQQAEEKNLRFDLIRKTENSVLHVDPYSIEQALNHLVDNALKFTNAGSVTITLKENEKENLAIIVEDTGIGISQSYLPKLFTPFSQEHQGLSRAYEGNGLGLALAKKLCDMNDVTIDVETEKGKGSKFILTFLQRIKKRKENYLKLINY